jgi:hypothetical protein
MAEEETGCNQAVGLALVLQFLVWTLTRVWEVIYSLSVQENGR